MLTEMVKNWWLFLLRGAVAIVFGFLAIIWPAQTWLTLVMLLGAFILLDGIFTLVAGIDIHRHFDGSWPVILEGAVGIVIGLLTLLWPGVASQAMVYLVAAWAVITGILEIAVATWIRHIVVGEWSMIVAGILSILLGILLFVYPAAGLVGLLWAIGVYAILFGITQVFFAARLHGLMSVREPSQARS